MNSKNIEKANNTLLHNSSIKPMYFTSERLLYIPLILLLDFGLFYTLSPFVTLLDIDIQDLFVNIQIFLLFVFTTDLFIKYRRWRKKQKPVYDEVSKFLEQT